MNPHRYQSSHRYSKKQTDVIANSASSLRISNYLSPFIFKKTFRLDQLILDKEMTTDERYEEFSFRSTLTSSLLLVALGLYVGNPYILFSSIQQPLLHEISDRRNDYVANSIFSCLIIFLVILQACPIIIPFVFGNDHKYSIATYVAIVIFRFYHPYETLVLLTSILGSLHIICFVIQDFVHIFRVCFVVIFIMNVGNHFHSIQG